MNPPVFILVLLAVSVTMPFSKTSPSLGSRSHLRVAAFYLNANTFPSLDGNSLESEGVERQ